MHATVEKKKSLYLIIQSISIQLLTLLHAFQGEHSFPYVGMSFMIRGPMKEFTLDATL